MAGKVSTASLVNAGLVAMERIGKPLSKLPSRGNAKLYNLPCGKTVRMRTCNRHALLVNAKHPNPNAKLDIEGTDWLLVVMPEQERTEGKNIVYLVPSLEAVAETRRANRQWLATKPATEGHNTAWTLEFRDHPVHDNYAIKWAEYRIDKCNK